MNSTSEIFFKQHEDLKNAVIQCFEGRTSLKFEESDEIFEKMSLNIQEKLHSKENSMNSDFLRYFLTSKEYPIILSNQDKEALIAYGYSYDFDNKYKLRLADRADLELIYNLSQNVYGGFDIIHVDVLRKWYDGNPSCFWLICDASQKGKMVGNVDILPLREEHPDVQKFLRGEMLEKDMGTDCIVSPDEIQNATIFYIESVVSYDVIKCKPINTPLRGIMQKARSIIRYITHYKTPDNCRLCCIAASGEGVALIEHLGFEVQQPKEQRVDEHNLYMIKFKDFVDNLNKFLIDYIHIFPDDSVPL